MSDPIFEQKKEKYLELRSQKQLADHFDKQHSIEHVLSLKDGDADIRTAGRVTAMRVMGKILFAHIYDFSGKVQICVRKTPEDPTSFDQFVENVSIGDFVGVEGEMFHTKTNEFTIRVSRFVLLNKCLRTLPDKFHGIEDIEIKYRQRYLDLIMTPESRDVFRKRIATIKSLRSTLEQNGFLEVETPILQTTPSGALARPFVTHHNALDISCVMRIAPETYLKRCIGAGMDRVYEFARCFRNEGISTAHLQDFSMLEFYAAYFNADIMRKFVAHMLQTLIKDVFQSNTVNIKGTEINFSGEWPVIDYCELIHKETKIDLNLCNAKESLISQMKKLSLTVDEDLNKASWATLVDAVYKKYCRPKLIQPCFLVKYPAEMSPLARRNAENEKYVDQFQLLVAGVELVKAYSELVDPIDQRERFEEQARARLDGDEEAMPMDEDYLAAMEHGFPPISGVGIGIDRLVMVLSGCDNIKDTVLFPLMRPHQSKQEAEEISEKKAEVQ